MRNCISTTYICSTYKHIRLYMQTTGHTESDADFVGKFPKGSVESWQLLNLSVRSEEAD
jgi:hypothetical protein